MTVEEIAAYAGACSLPGRDVPVLDGVPHWPWSPEMARCRLVREAELAAVLPVQGHQRGVRHLLARAR